MCKDIMRTPLDFARDATKAALVVALSNAGGRSGQGAVCVCM
jgi:hypothetical protein